MQQQRWNRRVFSNDKNKKQGRKHKQPHSTIEDVVSSVLVEKFHSNIVQFVKRLEKDLSGEASVYTHGGYALYAAAQSKLEEVKALHKTYPDELGPILTMPKDIDFSVLPRKPYTCNTFATCMANPVVKAVTGGLRDLRREIHNAIVNNAGLVDELLKRATEEARKALPGNITLQEMWLADTSHRHIERAGSNKNALVNRDNFRAPFNRCTRENMRVIDADAPPTARPGTAAAALSMAIQRNAQCFPLRDHLNATISFATTYDHNSAEEINDFVLCRLSLGVGVRFTDGNGASRTLEIPANFVDMSITRGGDHVYNGGALIQEPVVNRVDGMLPYPDISYIANNTHSQLTWNEKVLMTPDLDADTRAYTVRAVDKLKKRLAAIALLEKVGVKGATQTSSARASRSPQGNAEDLMAYYNRVIQKMGWLSGVMKQSVYNYVQSRMSVGARRGSKRSSVAVSAADVNVVIDSKRSQSFGKKTATKKASSPKKLSPGMVARSIAKAMSQRATSPRAQAAQMGIPSVMQSGLRRGNNQQLASMGARPGVTRNLAQIPGFNATGAALRA